VKYHRFFSRSLVLVLPILSGISTSLYAAQEIDPKWSLCTTHAAFDFHEEIETDESQAGATVLTADEAQTIRENVIKLEGNVRVTHDQQLLKADTAVYDKTTDIIKAENNIHYQREGLSAQGSTGNMELDSQTGVLHDTEFQLYDWHGRGSARKTSFEGSNITVLRKVRYTTCDYGNNDWLMRSSKVKLNHAKGIGSATNVVLSFKHVPFMYFPYISFPINDERKTGFLMPGYKSSSDLGDEVSIPYYINMAPNLDATLTPHIISNRGMLLDGEFRYLTTIGLGIVNVEYLADDEKYDGERGTLHYGHIGQITPRTHTNINLNYVSDQDYLKDFGDGLVATTTAHLERNAELAYLGDSWTTHIRLQGYQTIDETIPESSRPYQRLPQIQFNSNRPQKKNQLNYQLDSEYVFFEREDRVTAGRLDIQPVISYPVKTMAAFLTPKINLHHTQYNLQDQAPATDDRQNRTVPVFSMDSGIFLERDSHWGSRQFLQTLEPRLFYLYAPYQDQSDIPIFDSGAPDFNFTQMFMETRFSSVDRVGDANQISISITSRLLEADTGRERIRGSIGQIYYFQDREVTLSGTAVDTSTHSDILAEATSLITNNLTANSDLLWNVENNEISKGGIQFRYQAQRRHILNLSYRYRRDELSQADVSLLWPLTRSWHIISRWNYSLFDDQSLENLAGLEYQACCWKLHLISRHYLKQAAATNTPEIYDNAYYIQLELKGLASVGRSIKETLEESILGYVE